MPLGGVSLTRGDALLGLDDFTVLQSGLPDGAYAPLTGDDKAVAKALRSLNKAERERPLLAKAFRPTHLATEATRVRALPEETLAQVEAKRQAYATMARSAEGASLRLAANAWVVAFLTPKRSGQIVPTTRDVWEAAGGALQEGPMAREIERLARFARVFHWPLEFPAVLAGDDPGFDLVIGNPPWEVMQLSEEEYFAQRVPEIADLAGAARKRAIAGLTTTFPATFAGYERDKRVFDASNVFARESGRFDLTAHGKLNTYGLFAESFSRLSGKRGRAGIIVPTGIVTDATSAIFFSNLVENKRLVSLVDFENRAGIFSAVERKTKFSLITIGSDCQLANFSFFLTSVEQIADVDRCFTLSPDQIATMNPNTHTAPCFRSRADAELTAVIYGRVPVLVDQAKGEVGNPWGIEFRQGLFNMTSDSGLFRNVAQQVDAGFTRAGPDWVLPDGTVRFVPLYEAKMFHQFDHRWATYPIGLNDGGDAEGNRDTSMEEKADPGFEPSPRYWVPADELAARLGDKGWSREWLLCSRMIAPATNERTMIAGLIPLAAVGNSAAVWFPANGSVSELVMLYGNINSIVLDYVARQKVGGANLNFFILEQFPILPNTFYDQADVAFIVPRVLELTYTSHAMAPFARDLGFTGPPFAWNDDRRAHVRAEIDAWYARAYGLTRDQLRYILDPSDVLGADYPSETFRILKKNEIDRFGDYRTARLTLAAWDAQERGA